MALKIKHEQALAKLDPALANVLVKCFAFASPPVCLADPENDTVMAESMKDTYAFIHENDCVPFASIDAVRRLSSMVDEVDAATNFVEGPLMAIGKLAVYPRIKRKVMKDTELEFAEKADKLAIPAPYVMWMRRVDDDEDGHPLYNGMFCRPRVEDGEKGTNALQIMLDENMINDHMNPQYERAINSIAEQMKGLDGADGYVFPPN